MRVRRTRRVTAAVAVLAAASLVLSACARGDYSGKPEGGEKGGTVHLTYQTLAWQKDSIAANREMVKTWNAKHPKIQVKLVEGSWDNVNDQLVTAFEGGKAPDVIHYESAPLLDFVDRGNLLDLDKHLSKDFRADIRDNAWETVDIDGGVYGVPFLQECQVVYANRKALKAANIPLPTIEDPWTWDEYAAVAKKLTKKGQYGAMLPLKSPTNRILNVARNYGGDFFATKGGKSSAVFGSGESAVLTRMHDMLYKDRSVSPSGVGMSSPDSLPGFYEGRYATMLAPLWLRQQITAEAPDDFDWVTLPMLKGTSQKQGALAQTLSVAAESDHPKEATQFIEYFLSPKNQVKLALGEWLIPTSKTAAKDPRVNDPKGGWDVANDAARHLEIAPFQKLRGYEEWKSKIADPNLQKYFTNKATIDQLGTALTEDGNDVLKRYQR